MNKIYCLIFGLLFFSSCWNPKSDSITIAFKINANCDKEGKPLDSTVLYFPSELFYDSIPCINDNGSIIELSPYGSKEEYAKRFKRKIESLKDTFEIISDSFQLKINSYLLYKMNEPVLCDHYLNKKVYRMISLRSFHQPIVVRLEEYHDSIVILIKKLNKNIMYPFMVYGWNDSIFFTSPDVAFYDTTTNKLKIINKVKYDKQRKELKKENDSLCKIYNSLDYHLVLNQKKEISMTTWDSLEVMIDTTKFWKTNPDVALGLLQIDGSKWILEGHSKQGYQIKIIPSPHFEHYGFENNYYAILFKYIMKLASLEEEKLY
jgi:hypothetical protein